MDDADQHQSSVRASDNGNDLLEIICRMSSKGTLYGKVRKLQCNSNSFVGKGMKIASTQFPKVSNDN
jgi:hypothetical protein